jgi:uncharacterized membrane protein
VKVGADTNELALETAVAKEVLLNTAAVACIFRVNEPLLIASASRVVTKLNALVAFELSTSTRCATAVTVYRTLTPFVASRLTFVSRLFAGAGFFLAPLLIVSAIMTSVTLIMTIRDASRPVTNAATVVRNTSAAFGSARNSAAVQFARV